MEIRAIADCKTSLGEGPLWDVQEQKIYWLDSLGNKVFRANADGSHMEKWDLPQKVGSMALRKKGGAILCLQTGLYSFDFNSGEAALLFDPEPDKPTNRLNDGKVDRRGRFVFGSMDTKETDKSSSLYRLDPDLSLHTLENGIIVSNGPCWSPDSKTFYFAELVGDGNLSLRLGRGDRYAFSEADLRRLRQTPARDRRPGRRNRRR